MIVIASAYFLYMRRMNVSIARPHEVFPDGKLPKMLGLTTLVIGPIIALLGALFELPIIATGKSIVDADFAGLLDVLKLMWPLAIIIAVWDLNELRKVIRHIRNKGRVATEELM
jgi:hypothetical protein